MQFYNDSLIPLLLILLTTSSDAFSGNVSSNSRSGSIGSIDVDVQSGRRSFLETITTSTIVLTGVSSSINPVSASALASNENGLTVGGELRLGDDAIMAPKAHGTSETPVQNSLRYGVSNQLADKICNYTRHFAELGVSASYFCMNMYICISSRLFISL
jgi:hypothetical protein